MLIFILGFLAGIVAYTACIFTLGAVVVKSPQLSGKMLGRMTRTMMRRGK